MGAAFSRDLTQAIAFKSSTSSDEANRSHNQKQQIQNYKVSFQIRLAVFFGQRRRLYETTPKWHGFYDYTGRFGSRVKQRTAEYRITNNEFRSVESLRSLFL